MPVVPAHAGLALRGWGPRPTASPRPGLQPERTALAWRRTALSIAVGSLAAGRVLDDAWLVAAAGVALGVGLLLAARHRAARIDRALHADGDLRAGPGAGLVAITAGVAVVVAVTGVVVTVTR